MNVSPSDPRKLGSPGDVTRVGVVGLGYWGPNLARNLEALHADLIVLRHSSAGAAQFLAERLDAGHLEVLVARFVDDMTQEEIALHLGLSRKTIGKRLDRIRDEVIALRKEASA